MRVRRSTDHYYDYAADDERWRDQGRLFQNNGNCLWNQTRKTVKTNANVNEPMQNMIVITSRQFHLHVAVMPAFFQKLKALRPQTVTG